MLFYFVYMHLEEGVGLADGAGGRLLPATSYS